MKLYINTNAKNFVNQIAKHLNDDNIRKWMSEKNVKLYINYEDDKIVSFILLSKMSLDPLKMHSNPYMLNYIYTFTEYRQKGCATTLLKYVKEREELSAPMDEYVCDYIMAQCGFELIRSQKVWRN